MEGLRNGVDDGLEEDWKLGGDLSFDVTNSTLCI